MAQTLLDLHLHYTYAMSLTTISWLVDVTIKNIVLTTSYDKVGPNATFHIWVMVFVMDMMGLRFIFNILILFQACARMPEFCGYQSRRYPGQPPPRPPRIAPRTGSGPGLAPGGGESWTAECQLSENPYK